MTVNARLSKIINLVHLMNLTLNNRPIFESDGDLIKSCLMDIACIFANLPEHSIQSNCTQAIIREIKTNLDAVSKKVL